MADQAAKEVNLVTGKTAVTFRAFCQENTVSLKLPINNASMRLYRLRSEISYKTGCKFQGVGWAPGAERMKCAGRRASGEVTYMLQPILYLSIYRWVVLRLTSVWTEKNTSVVCWHNDLHLLEKTTSKYSDFLSKIHTKPIQIISVTPANFLRYLIKNSQIPSK